jgi:GMP synthase-like glutamine amidotransferase
MGTIKIAILDLYAGHANEGMRCIREILKDIQNKHGITMSWDEFDVRNSIEIPGMQYDLYISSGGPGSPIDSMGEAWDNAYFNWLEKVVQWNEDAEQINKKFVFFICHSFQLACRYFEIGQVTKRKSTSFGVFPIHWINATERDPVFQGLEDPFYGVDSRDFQVIQPDAHRLEEIGGELLCLEKERPHIQLERAVMAVRFNPWMIGTQFHPEADPQGMSMYLQQEEKKRNIIDNHGFEKWQSMIDHLNDPDKIRLTHNQVLPNFILQSIAKINYPYSLS